MTVCKCLEVLFGGKKQSVQTAVQHSALRPQSWKLLKQSQMDQEANLLLLFVCLFVLKTNPFSESMNCGSMSTAQKTFFSTEHHLESPIWAQRGQIAHPNTSRNKRIKHFLAPPTKKNTWKTFTSNGLRNVCEIKYIHLNLCHLLCFMYITHTAVTPTHLSCQTP